METHAGSVARVADDPIAPCFLERWSPRAFALSRSQKPSS